MIAALISWCVRNSLLVWILGALLVGLGIWSARTLTVDAIPDLSDVQVIVRTEFPGQAPRIVEDQVTYPLTRTMLSVPHSRTVRGFSMFGTSFVYIIFEDGTDIYWARSRVLEQLSTVASRLPPGVSPQLGPDATGVGWIYQYALTTGRYCPRHPDGLWQDPTTERWYAKPSDAPEEVQARLVHQRVFPEAPARWLDPESGRSYAAPDFAEAGVRSQLVRHGERATHTICPLDGGPLAEPNTDLAQLRSLQDWYLRYELTSVNGVSEVASVGGFVNQYQVTVDPVKLRAYGISLGQVARAIERSNQETGGRVIERGETEFVVQGRGYLGTLTDAEVAVERAAGRDPAALRTQQVQDDLRSIALRSDEQGAPVRLGDIAEIGRGPEIRRGIADLNGQGEVVGGIVVMRFGENARDTIVRVRERLDEAARGLPPGVGVVTTYDRSDLIDRAVHTLTGTLIEELTVVSLVVLLFLLHARSALVALVVLPTGILGSLILMKLTGLSGNIMSLGGIAIAIGVMVDAAIVMVENAHKEIERERDLVANGAAPRAFGDLIATAAADVGKPLFFSLLIITVSFVPVFVLTGQSGKLFAPLAWTKTFAIGVSALLSITLIPTVMAVFLRERMTPVNWSRQRTRLVLAATILVPAAIVAVVPLPHLEHLRWWIAGGWMALSALLLLPQRIVDERHNPISMILQRLYEPVFRFSMRNRLLVIGLAIVALAVTVVPFRQLGSEFMPPLEEGDFLYMPNTDPGLSSTKARELLQQTDALIKQFPEVTGVFGKAGRSDSATDPAPLTMIETVVLLERDHSKWRRVPTTSWFGLRHGTRPITLDELTDGYELPGGKRVPGINDALRLPGLTGALTRGTMPIRTRIDMLATGIRTPVGVKLMGPDLAVLERLTDSVAQAIKTDTRTAGMTASVATDRAVGGSYLDVAIDRGAIARYGLQIADVQEAVTTALGGRNVTFTVEGLERYGVQLRYARELRDDPAAIGSVLIATPAGGQVPLAELAQLVERNGPPMIKSENARPSSWIYVVPVGSDLGGYVAAAKQVVADHVQMPAGYSLAFSGQYEYMLEANRRLSVAIPLAAVAIVILLYIGTRSWLQTGIVLLAVPFSLIGAVWLLWFLDFNTSVAVWVGVIALAGLDAETGLVMLHFLQDSCKRFAAEGRLNTEADLHAAVHDGAVKRIRPKTMTVLVAFTGLLPLLFAEGAGADTMRRLAAPMLGGLTTSFLMELVIYPVIWFTVMRRHVGMHKVGVSADVSNR